MTFDFLRPARRSAFDSLRVLHVPENAVPAIVALLTALIVAVCGITAERERLHAALLLEQQYRARADRAASRAQLLRADWGRVRALQRLADRVQRLSLSGDLAVQPVLRISLALPAHAWLTAVRQDGTSLEVQGDARGMDRVGSLIQAFTGAGIGSDPSLLQLKNVTERTRHVAQYAVRFDRVQ